MSTLSELLLIPPPRHHGIVGTFRATHHFSTDEDSCLSGFLYSLFHCQKSFLPSPSHPFFVSPFNFIFPYNFRLRMKNYKSRRKILTAPLPIGPQISIFLLGSPLTPSLNNLVSDMMPVYLRYLLQHAYPMGENSKGILHLIAQCGNQESSMHSVLPS